MSIQLGAQAERACLCDEVLGRLADALSHADEALDHQVWKLLALNLAVQQLDAGRRVQQQRQQRSAADRPVHAPRDEQLLT